MRDLHSARARLFGVGGSILLILGLLPNQSVQALNFFVSTPIDLTGAIRTANASPGVDTITLLNDITLTTVDNMTDGPNGLPSITDDLIIYGNDGIIERSVADGTPNFRIFHVAVGGSLRLENVTLRNGLLIGNTGSSGFSGSAGNDGSNGGGQDHGDNGSNGGNGATGGFARGGAIFNRGRLEIVGSTLQGNLAQGGDGGDGGNGGDGGDGGNGGGGGQGGFAQDGAVYNTGGQVSIFDSIFQDNMAQAGNGGSGGRGGFCGLGGAGGDGFIDVVIGVNLQDADHGGHGGDGGHGGSGGSGHAGEGGAIYSIGGLLEISRSVLLNNRAVGGAGGAGASGW